MQRQSMGSPSSKLVRDEQFTAENQKQLASSSSLSSTSPSVGGLLYGEKECKEEEEEEELKKLMKLNPRTAVPESYIHLIPTLTLLCFLVLYLSSHDPSPIDLTQFNGFKTSSSLAEGNVSELQRVVEIRKDDILAIRSLKNLEQEAETARLRRRHRKMARA